MKLIKCNKIKLYQNIKRGIEVSTIRITNCEYKFQIAIVHPDCKQGRTVVVDTSDTAKDALNKHHLWVENMEKGYLPSGDYYNDIDAFPKES